MRDHFIRFLYSIVALICFNPVGFVIFSPLIGIMAMVADYYGWKSDDVL